MTNITVFNALVRQLLIHLGDEEGINLIVSALNGKKQVKVLRALALHDKTIPQIHEATGIGENYLYHVVNKLAKLGVIEVKRKVPNKTPEKGGSETKVWGLI